MQENIIMACFNGKNNGGVAQGIEPRTTNPLRVGSSPTPATIFNCLATRCC